MEENKKNIISFSAKTNNKVVYLVLVEDPSIEHKFRAFLGEPSTDFSGNLLSIKGYEINWDDRDKVKSFEDALALVNKSNDSPEDSVEVKYPWAKVLCVKNICYKRSDVK